jgi:hypothetical protein
MTRLQTSATIFALTAAFALSACDDDDTQDTTTGTTTDVDPTTTTTSTTSTSTAGEDATTASDDTGAETGTTGDSDGTTGGDSGSSTGGEPDLNEVECVDQLIQDLSLNEDVISEGDVTSVQDGDDWVSTLDATAGGLPNAPMRPWLYVAFTDEGLEKIDTDDIDALDTGDWDIAAKRFGVRVNSGSSGPSSVQVAVMEDMQYGEITEVPDDATFEIEDFYTDACDLVDDGSGFGSPAYRMASWWSYPGCVATTGTPFVLQLADGRHVKLVIEAYYETGQQECNDNGTMGSGSANVTWRWAFLD